jgi:hypothetical protein
MKSRCVRVRQGIVAREREGVFSRSFQKSGPGVGPPFDTPRGPRARTRPAPSPTVFALGRCGPAPGRSVAVGVAAALNADWTAVSGGRGHNLEATLPHEGSNRTLRRGQVAWPLDDQARNFVGSFEGARPSRSLRPAVPGLRSEDRVGRQRHGGASSDASGEDDPGRGRGRAASCPPLPGRAATRL